VEGASEEDDEEDEIGTTIQGSMQRMDMAGTYFYGVDG
jgi:hypothetical protein